MSVVVPSKLSYLAVGWCLLLASWLLTAGCGKEERSDETGLEGPLRLHPDNPRIFIFRGEPTVLVTSAEHYGAVINAGFDFVPYLDELAADGLNQTRLFSGSYFELPDSIEGIGADNTLAPAPDDLLTPWVRDGEKFDLDRWNDAYFERLGDFVTAAGERGIVVELTLFSALYDKARWAINPFNARNNVQGVGGTDPARLYTLENAGALRYQEELARKLVTELNAFDNVYYEVINEPWMPPALASEAWEDRIVETIDAAEAELPNRHLTARNYNQNTGPQGEADAAVTVSNFHYLRDPGAYSAELEGALAFDETGFQGTDPAPYREDAWYFMLNGGAVYSNLDWSFAVGHERGTLEIPRGTPGSGGGELRRQLGVLASFLSRFDLVQLEPSSELVSRAPEGATVRVASDGSTYGVYMSGVGRGSVGVELPPGRYSLEWIDPADGKVLRRKKLEHGGGESELSPPPHELDIALALERRGGDG